MPTYFLKLVNALNRLYIGPSLETVIKPFFLVLSSPDVCSVGFHIVLTLIVYVI